MLHSQAALSASQEWMRAALKSLTHSEEGMRDSQAGIIHS